MQGKDLTLDQKVKFIKKLKTTNGNVSKAAQAAGIGRATAYVHKKNDHDFSLLWDEMIDAVVDEMEAECYRRAVKGVVKPVYQQGKKVGSIREYSDGLLQFALKGKRPEIYRERFDIQTEVSGTLDITIDSKIDEVYDDLDIDAIDLDQIISDDTDSPHQ